MTIQPRIAPAVPDAEVIQSVLSGAVGDFELLMRRYNERVYRVVRSRVSNESDVEEIMQRTYLAAFRSLSGFEGRARFSTWLTRIALNECHHWHHPSGPKLVALADANVLTTTQAPDDPERDMHYAQIAALLETAIDELPETLRTTFVLREIEGESTADVAATLMITEQAVRVRVHRARRHLEQRLSEEMGTALGEMFRFYAPRCDRVVAAVLRALE